MDFDRLKVPDLKQYLQERGVTCSLYRKDHLIRLCKLANELDLPTIDQNLDVNREAVLSSTQRRTVEVNDKTIVLPRIDDPSITNWSSNIALLPSVENADVLVYLYHYCEWSAQRLKAYKGDNGFQLHVANHISDVQISPHIDGAYFYIRSTCIPETRQNDTPYSVWVLLRSSGEVVSGGCTCVVDNGACKHCVALLFSLVSFNERHKDRFTEACTDLACSWDKPKKTTEPMEIDDIDMRKDTSVEMKPTPCAKTYVPSCSITNKNVEKELYKLFENTDSLVLQTLDPPSDVSEDESEVKVPTMAETLSTLGEKSVTEHLKSVYDNETISQIEKLTQGQAENETWFDHRQGRITASLFHSVMHFKYSDNPQNYILKKILSKERNALYPSLAFGRSNEPVARQQYYEMYRALHKNFKIEECGLFVDKKNPFMGASPDGVVSCSCCGKGLLEIKCSFTYQNVTANEACLDDHYHLYCDENNTVRLKDSSSWYVQIQGQMGVCGLPWCDFVFFTRKGISIDRIHYDHDMFTNIVQKSEKFFHKYVVKALTDNV